MHIVIEHCTNYYVILHLKQTNSHIQLNTGCDQNSSVSSNHSERSLKNLSYQLFTFHDFPGPRPDSRTFQARKM